MIPQAFVLLSGCLSLTTCFSLQPASPFRPPAPAAARVLSPIALRPAELLSVGGRARFRVREGSLELRAKGKEEDKKEGGGWWRFGIGGSGGSASSGPKGSGEKKGQGDPKVPGNVEPQSKRAGGSGELSAEEAEDLGRPAASNPIGGFREQLADSVLSAAQASQQRGGMSGDSEADESSWKLPFRTESSSAEVRASKKTDGGGSSREDKADTPVLEDLVSAVQKYQAILQDGVRENLDLSAFVNLENVSALLLQNNSTALAEEGSILKVLLKELEKARKDLAISAVRISQLEQAVKTVGLLDLAIASSKNATIAGGEGFAEQAATSTSTKSVVGENTTVSVQREGTQTIIRVINDEDPSTTSRMMSMLNSAFSGFVSKTKDETETREESSTSVKGSDTKPTKREKKVSDTTVKVLTSVSTVKRAWYGTAKDLDKLYQMKGKLDQSKDEDVQMGASIWDSLWAGEPSKLPGKDVTKEVLNTLRVERAGRSSWIGNLTLPSNLNSLFGDPAFGQSKILVVEYGDGMGNNLTAVFEEERPRPRVWINQASWEVIRELANPPAMNALEAAMGEGGPNATTEKLKNPELQTAAPAALNMSRDGSSNTGPAEGAYFQDGISNGWIKKVLFQDDEAFRDEIWSESQEESSVPLEDKPPPPVIPFIKYASPGPPSSPWTDPDCALPTFRILSLDGGGIRGVLAAVVLGRIVKEVPTFLDNVDLIAGTSTGGLIALMLASGYTPQECQDIYEYGCPLIFAKDPWRVYNPLKAKYSAQGREDLCKTYLSDDRTLKDLKKFVVCTAFKLDGEIPNMGAFISMNGGWRPSVFSNIPRMEGIIEPDLDVQCWDAALRTSAAPTYFPSHKGYVDGAMFANSPAMLAVTKACAHFPGVTPNNIVVMSLGCGNYPISIKSEDEEDPNKDLDWGIKDWVPYIFDLMMDGDSLSSELLLRYMLASPSKSFSPDNRYHRIDPTLPRYVELDDVSQIPDMVKIAEQIDLTDAIAFAERHFSTTPTASDAFAQAAVKTANWAREQASKVQLSEVIGSFTALPNIQDINLTASGGTWPGWGSSAPEGRSGGDLYSGPGGSRSKGDSGGKRHTEDAAASAFAAAVKKKKHEPSDHEGAHQDSSVMSPGKEKSTSPVQGSEDA